MMNKENEVRQRLVKALNLPLMIAPLWLTWIGLYQAEYRHSVPFQTAALLMLTAAVMYVLFGRVYDAFLLDVDRISEMVLSQMLAALVTDTFEFVILWMLLARFPGRWELLLVPPCQLAASICWSVLAHRWYFSHFPPKRTLVISNSRAEAEQLAELNGFGKKFSLTAICTTEQFMQDYEQFLDQVEVVFLLHTNNAWAVMQLCAFKGVRIYRMPLISEIIASRAKSVTIFHTPMLRMDGYNPSMTYLFVKRCMDLLFSAAALLLVSPLMLGVAAAIKLGDGGPVFYRQIRLTQGGRPFYTLKFRSMRVDAESDGVARLSSGDADDRITPVGRWIRKVRIDELPQLLNILKGDMSLVGPRPERPELTEEYAQCMPEFKLRLLAKAGLTGYAQVYGKYNTSPADKLSMDLMYMLRPSITEDLRIMFATVKILFIPESTEGVEEGKTNAMK